MIRNMKYFQNVITNVLALANLGLSGSTEDATALPLNCSQIFCITVKVLITHRSPRGGFLISDTPEGGLLESGGLIELLRYAKKTKFISLNFFRCGTPQLR